MSGGGGGGSKKAAAPKEAEKLLTDYGNAPIVVNMNPFMGDNQNMIAQQLAAGFGGTPESHIAGMGMYQPYNSVGLFEPLTETANEKLAGTTGIISLDKALGLKAISVAGNGGKTNSASGSKSAIDNEKERRIAATNKQLERQYNR